MKLFGEKIAKNNRVLNLRKDTEDLRDFSYKLIIQDKIKMKEVMKEVPKEIDHTEYISPVKDQKNLGSCVGFAVTAIKEWQEQKEHADEVAAGKKNHRDDKYYDLSEAWVYWNCKKIDDWPNEEGTSIRCGMKVLHKIGVPVEYAWPYNDKVRGEPKNWAALVARWSLIDSYYRVEGLDQIRVAISNGPIVIGVGVYEEMFYVGDDGIVPMPTQPQYCYGGHALACVGFSNSKKLFKCKNSWGSEFGDNGYIYLHYKYINNYLWDAWACKDLSITKEMLKGVRNLIE